jgi:Bax protein
MTEHRSHTTLWRRGALLTVMLLSLAALFYWQQQQVDNDEAESEQNTPPIWPIPKDSTQARKARLVNLLLPAIQHNNRQLLEKRERLEQLHEKISSAQNLAADEQSWLEEQSQQYRLDIPESLNKSWSRILLRRLDIVPADLALAQGALESAWGTSRFAKEGNNYFGHWCFVPGCGLVPKGRVKGARHEVARFSSAKESVRRYMLNLNSHPRYAELRLIREQARQAGNSPNGSDLAAGLEGYSELSEEYIERVRSLIRQNDFSRFSDY